MLKFNIVVPSIRSDLLIKCVQGIIVQIIKTMVYQ